MQVVLGRIKTEYCRPSTAKFAAPIVLLPEVFTTAAHSAFLTGYLNSLGWEVYVAELHGGLAATAPGFHSVFEMLGEALHALGRGVIVAGHGLGGLLAMKLAEHEGVRAAVAIAPLVPGYDTRLFARRRAFRRFRNDSMIQPPRGSRLMEMLADAEPFERERIAGSMVAEAAETARALVRGELEFAAGEIVCPRLVIHGEQDRFAPIEKVRGLASGLGARLEIIPGRGHWLIGGRALERTASAMQRFLVRELGEELLLLYPGDEGETPDE
jgi:pimeloyl-ACP methyl ester carboxylesterase